MSDVEPAWDDPSPRGGGVPGWVFAVVPAVVVGLLVAVVGIAVRSGDSDEPREEGVDRPAPELPAVVEAAELLIGRVPPVPERAAAVGARAGEIARGLVDLSDDLEFAQRFDRLPPAEAELLGEALGAIQRQLSPRAVGGPRGGDDRRPDMTFALQLVWAAAPVLDPDAAPLIQAYNVLPASVPLADNGDEIAAAVAAGAFERAAELLEPVLSEAGAAEIISGLAGDISDRVGARNDDTRLRAFQDAYNREIP